MINQDIHLFWKLIGIYIAWLGIIVGLADPRIPDAVAALQISGRDIILAIDLQAVWPNMTLNLTAYQ